ncbi:MAG: tetratricopeptide repeat protein, partial [Sediminibacterium sp.]|nr:tetratricopeptide repeat protein [Sediminibacterium sp.]
MKPWRIALLPVLFAACTNEPKNTVPDALKKDEMPATIQQLFSKLGQHPDSVGLRMQLVDALDSLGAYQQAMSQMDSLIRKDSLNYGLWYRKAQLQQNTHDTMGALKSYRYAIRIYPAPDAMLAAGNLLAEKKDTLALTIAKQVMDLHMGREYTAHCSFITGVYYARTGDKKKAMNAFNTCISNDYSYLEAYMEKGFLLYDDKKFTGALKEFQTLSMVKNTYPDGYYWMAK